jgi:hypothetical protein
MVILYFQPSIIISADFYTICIYFGCYSGKQILRLLKSFVEHYANELSVDGKEILRAEDQRTAATTTVPARIIGSTPESSSARHFAGKRPLIEEISPADGITPNAASASTTATMKSLPIVINSSTDSMSASAVPKVSEDPEMIASVLGLLAAILSLGHDRRPDDEEALIRSLLQPLQLIAFRARDSSGSIDVIGDTGGDDQQGTSSIGETASDVALMILSRSYQQTHPDRSSERVSSNDRLPTECFEDMIARMRTSEFLFADSPAMRGYGTRIIMQNVHFRLNQVNNLSKNALSVC